MQRKIQSTLANAVTVVCNWTKSSKSFSTILKKKLDFIACIKRHFCADILTLWVVKIRLLQSYQTFKSLLGLKAYNYFTDMPKRKRVKSDK